MLVRYCAAHPGFYGYPRLLGVRWNGWQLTTAGGLCEACRERERARWNSSPYGEVLVPVPVELGPRMLGRRVVLAIVAGAAAATVVMAALLVVTPPDFIPSGGEPGYVSSGARLAEPPPTMQAEVEDERPAASRPQLPTRAVSSVAVSRAVPRAKRTAAARVTSAPVSFATTIAYVRACPTRFDAVARGRVAIAQTESP